MRAAISADEVAKVNSSADPSFGKFVNRANGFGLKNSNITPTNVKAFQFDCPFVSDWRVFGLSEVNEIRSVRNRIENPEENGELETAAIVCAIEKGYASRKDGKLKLFVPYFDAV